MKLKDYKGYEIEVFPYDGDFRISGTPYGFLTLKQAEGKIDALVQAENKEGLPLEVIRIWGWNNEAGIVTITSKNTEDKSCWYKDAGGYRHKENLRDNEPVFFEATQDNLDIIAEHETLNAHIRALESKRNALKLKDPIDFTRKESTTE